jgi:hypothetical protein
MERNATCVCPFCGCLYDHDELVALYEAGASGELSRDEALEALAEFHDKVLAEPGNAEPAGERS